VPPSNTIEQYEKLTNQYLDDPKVVVGQMFGKPCVKVKGKAFLAQHKEAIVFKLSGTAHEKAMSHKGAVLWDPSGKGRPMKEWVALPVTAKGSFKTLAAAAYDYVANAV